MSRDRVTIRPVEPSELPAIVRIDEGLSGSARKEYWQWRLDKR